MWQKIRDFLCRLGWHKWEELPTEKVFKITFNDDGTIHICKGSLLVGNVVPIVFKCKYCNKALVKSSPWDKGEIIDWWGGVKDVAED